MVTMAGECLALARVVLSDLAGRSLSLEPYVSMKPPLIAFELSVKLM